MNVMSIIFQNRYFGLIPFQPSVSTTTTTTTNAKTNANETKATATTSTTTGTTTTTPPTPTATTIWIFTRQRQLYSVFFVACFVQPGTGFVVASKGVDQEL